MRLLLAHVPERVGRTRGNSDACSAAEGQLATAEAAAQRAREDLDALLLYGVQVLVAQEPARSHEEVEAQELACGVLRHLSEDDALPV